MNWFYVSADREASEGEYVQATNPVEAMKNSAKYGRRLDRTAVQAWVVPLYEVNVVEWVIEHLLELELLDCTDGYGDHESPLFDFDLTPTRVTLAGLLMLMQQTGQLQRAYEEAAPGTMIEIDEEEQA